MGQVAAVIQTKIQAALNPELLQLENESDQHSGPPNRETHFKLTLVAPAFEGMLRVKRHQQVYALLADEMAAGVHALALHLYTPAEWAARAQERPDSPQCRGVGQ